VREEDRRNMGIRELADRVRVRRARIAAAAAVAAVAGVAGFEAAVASPGSTFTVSSTGDALDARPGDGSCATVSGACTLRAAVQEANALPGADVIDVPAGTYEIGILPLNQNDIATGDIDITDSAAINGAGAPSTIIDAGVPLAGAPPEVHGLDRIFEVAVDGGEVSFSGLTLSDGYAAEYGGAIAINSTAAVSVVGSVLTRNVAGKAGGAIDNHLGGSVDVRNSTVVNNFASENGSAINNNRDGSLTITGSTISSNSAADIGRDELLAGAGAISNNAELDTIGTIAVRGSTMSDNRAGGGRPGAAIANDGAGTVVVDGTTLSKNIAAGDGGAISNKAGDVTVTGSTFAANAAHDGGAIYNDGALDGRVTVRGSEFSLNSASARGGAIEGGGTGTVTVVDGAFSKNSADDLGGAISSSDKASMTIVSSSFTENSGLSGGGFANEGAGVVTVENSTFTKNTAFAGIILASGEGGGMHSNSGGEVTISGGAFTGNQARSGGGLSNEGGGILTISGTRFSDNRADEQGGGILIQSGSVRLLNIDVAGNVADGAEEGGGGISYAGDKVVTIGETAAIEQSRIRGNKAKGAGGGIDSRGDGALSITTTSITGNTAATGGAIHHVGDAPLDVTRSTLSGNFAESGGALFVDGDGEATLENTTVSTNRAGQFGGGLLVSSRVNVRNSTIASNTAAVGGGINNGGGDLVGDGSVFLVNTIVANSLTGGNCAGTITSLGGNVDSANTCQFREISDQPGTDPRLGPLAANGGPTETHALLAGSAAQETALCTDVQPCPPVDQRGVERPRFDGFDIGPYESELTPGGGGEQRCAGLTERPVLVDYDSWISQSAASSNFGNDSILRVEADAGGSERALVHLDLPPIPPGCKLISATLRLYAASATEGRTLEAVRIASEWSELGVNWAMQPATAGPAATTESGLDTREWDVLAQTLDMYAHGEYGFLIRDTVESGSGSQSFHSGEKGPEHQPQLILVFDDPDAPPVPGTCPTTPQVLSADRDSWVSEGSPFNNFGSDSSLKVKSQVSANARALIRFPLPILPSGCTGVASAALRMEASSAKEGRTLEALQVASAWTEAGVTWSNQPGVTGPAATTPSAQGPLEWDVTEQLLGMYTSVNHGFLIRDAVENGVGDEQALDSRHKITDNAPQLLLVFDDSTPETVIVSGPVSPTDSSSATFTFSSDRADARFECSLDGGAFAACTSPYVVADVAESDHSFQVRATRRVRAVDPTPATYDWKVAIPPETTIDSGPDSPSASPDAALTFSADDREATFECSLNGASFAACASPVAYANLADGPNEFRVRAIDPHGNADPTPATHSWLVAVPPETTITGGPPDPTSSTSASLSFSADEPATFECALDAGQWEACSSPIELTGLAEGEHTLRVRGTDAAGNTDPDPARYAWTVDTTAPIVTITAGPPDLTNDTGAKFDFRADEPAELECRLDTGDWTACTSPREYRDLADGRHTFEVRATDGAGNIGDAATYAWTIDTTAPTVTITAGPPALTNATTASFDFEANEPAELECRLDAGAWTACASPYELAGPLVDGDHELHVRATDTAGNTGDEATYAWTIDTIAPRTTIESGPRQASNSTAASFAFTTDETASFECRLDTGDWTACTSPQGYADLAEGLHAFDVRASDRAGNLGDAASSSWRIDTAAPVTTITAGPPALANRTSATFEFSADEATSFECRLDTSDWTDCTSPHELAGPLADGDHELHVRATDTAGNTGDEATYAWTIDTTAPTVTITTGPRETTNSTAASFEITANEPATLECRLDSGGWTACTSPHELAGPLTDGDHTFEVRATDTAGNTGAGTSRSWTVDTRAPTATITAGPRALTNATAASFQFEADEAATLECRLDTGDWTVCTSPHEYLDLADGDHTFQVRATDAAGNLGAAATSTWTIDTAAPATTITASPSALTNRASATFEFSADEATSFECRLDAGDWTACTSPQSFADLADGRHAVEIRATDKAGNTGQPASSTWTIDTIAPITTITSGPRETTNSTAASFEFTADEAASFECRLDEGDWTACTSPRLYVDLAAGRHTVQVRGTDHAGNTGLAATYSWTIDTHAPTTTVTAGPLAVTNRTSATFEFTADETAGFQCRLDAGDWTPCTSPYELAGPLADGDHTFEARATDPAGNTGAAATYTWTIDTLAPGTTITDGPPASPFVFEASEPARFECRLDGGDWMPCTSPHAYPDLTDGEHTVEIRATDDAGNTGPAAPYVWTIDTSAPETTIISGPPVLTNSTTATFVFAADQHAALECRLDAGEWAACTSPHAYLDLTDGRHTFEVRATDETGNAGPAAGYSWTIDTAAPATTITAAPDGPTNRRSATFEFRADEPAGLECRLDGGDWTACASPQLYLDLTDGQHTFAVRATDQAGNTGAAATSTWTIDTVAPQTQIDDRPPATTEATTATFTFSADEPGATFECSLDGEAFAGCTSPREYRELAPGSHEFHVRARDRAGNGDESPASHRWTIVVPPLPDTTAPETTLTDQPPDPTSSTPASFAFTGSDDTTPASQLRFECRLDSQVETDFVTCSSPSLYAGLGQGAHTFEVRAVDLAGNADTTPAAYTWSVDTTAPQTTITDAPPATTAQTSAQFGFEADELGSRFECSRDGGAWTACASPVRYDTVGAGIHEFGVRAIDRAGNVDPTPATHRWTVDTAAPQTAITSAPPATTSSTSARFTFTADEPGSRFECALDGAAPTPCTSPRDYTGLTAGAHQFRVRAIDPAGNTDPTPASHSWTISTAPACGQTLTAAAAADAWIDENSPTNNKGSDSILKVQSKGPSDNFRALVRFTLPAVPEGCTIQSATLRLYAASAKPSRTLHALRVTSAWTENQVSWASQLMTTGSAAVTTSGLGYREWNVTTHVQAMYQGPNHGFLIRDAVEGQDAEQQFHSREKGENPPQLVIRLAAAAG